MIRAEIGRPTPDRLLKVAQAHAPRRALTSSRSTKPAGSTPGSWSGWQEIIDLEARVSRARPASAIPRFDAAAEGGRAFQRCASCRIGVSAGRSARLDAVRRRRAA